ASTGLLGIAHERSNASHSRAGLFAADLQILHAFARPRVYNKLYGIRRTRSFFRENTDKKGGNPNMSNAKKILIVEDDENIRELLRLYLEREGYEISEAENGAVGLSKWKAENPDMMLLDVMMPVMDGWQVIREIRESGS